MITEERKKELKEFAKELFELEKQWQKNKGDKTIEGEIISKMMGLESFEEMDFVDNHITNILTK